MDTLLLNLVTVELNILSRVTLSGAERRSSDVLESQFDKDSRPELPPHLEMAPWAMWPCHTTARALRFCILHDR